MPGIRACACAYLSSVNQASVLCMYKFVLNLFLLIIIFLSCRPG